MQLRHFLVALSFGLTGVAAAEDPMRADPFPERLIALCAAASAPAEDLAFLQSLAEGVEPTACLAHALLFKFAPVENVQRFRAYFRVDRQLTIAVLPDATINERVNATLRELNGRPPPEQMTYVYLKFRGTGFVAKRTDGSALNLEEMFRGSVFAAVTGGSREEVLRFASQADAKD